MRVGIDYLPAVTHAPGVGRYARELVRALVARDDAPELALWEVGGGARRLPEAALGLGRGRARRLRLRLPRRLVRPLLRGPCRVERLLGGIDLFHHIHAGWPPVSSVPRVLAIAELPPRGTRAEAELASHAQGLAAIAVFCEHYRARVAVSLAVAPERIHALPVGCDHWLRDLNGMRLPRAEPARVLVLGALRPARAPLLALAGFERLLARGVRAELVFAGLPSSATADFELALARSGARAAVRWIAAPRESEMPALVASSTVLLHLAEEEGSPVTALEACAAGLAVVASPLPAFHEVLGENALWFPPGASAQELGRLLEAALVDARDPGRCHARVELALPYTWDRNAARTVALWKTLCEKPGAAPSALLQDA